MATPPKEWTTGRRRSFITSVLRGGYRRWPPKYETLKEAFVGKKINPSSKRLSAHYECNKCKGHFPTKEVQVDHIKPIVDPVKGFEGFDKFAENLFCPKENLQVLCSGCHGKKTLGENKLRKSVVSAKEKKVE